MDKGNLVDEKNIQQVVIVDTGYPQAKKKPNNFGLHIIHIHTK